MDSTREGRDRYCTPCLTDQKSIKSNVYCLDCESYYCDDCFMLHKKVPNLAKHIVLRNKEIDLWKTIPYKCKTHNKCYEFFCEDHSEVCCQACVSLEHRSCEHMKYIKENTDDPIFKKESKILLSKTEKQINAVLSQIETLERKRELNEASKGDAEKCLKDIRSKMNETLDNLQLAADEQIQGRYNSNENALEKNGTKLEKMKTNLDELKLQLSSSQSPAIGILPFICQMNGQKQVADVEQALLQMKKEMPEVEFRFVLDPSIEEFFRSIDKIGKISDKRQHNVDCSSEYVDEETDNHNDGNRSDAAGAVCSVASFVPAFGYKSASVNQKNKKSKRKQRSRKLADLNKDTPIQERVNDDNFEDSIAFQSEYRQEPDDYNVDQEDVDTDSNYYIDPYDHDWALQSPKVPLKTCSNVRCLLVIKSNRKFCPECGAKQSC